MPVSVPLTSSGIPKAEDAPESNWNPSTEVMEFLRKKSKRIRVLLNHRAKYEPGMRESILLYEGKSILVSKDKRDLEVVMPLAADFVEAKTSEEVRTMNTYEYSTQEGSASTWRTGIMKQLSNHAQRRVKLRGKRSELVRMKNIAGNSILRVGYRKIMRQIKERIEGDEDALNVKWEKVTVPMYDDLFVQVVSPLNFAIDPNAKTMDDAMDCYHAHIENWEGFHEAYGKDPRFDADAVNAVTPGAKFKFDDQGQFVFDHTVADGGVMIEEYFCKPLDEWVVVANGVLLSDPDQPLPDDHKEIPFVAFQNHPVFLVSLAANAGIVQSKDVSDIEQALAEEGFWRKGDPLVIKDLIDLNTGFTRAMFRNAKLASQTITATMEGYKFNENRAWRDGDQAEGMMNKFINVPMATGTMGNVMPILEYLFEQMVLRIGTDPRNLSEGKQKTATEAAIMRENAAARLEEGLIFNEENNETRLGMLITKDAEQYYSKPEVVRLTGLEDKKQLEKFDDVVYSPNTDLPVYGKRIRRIKTDKKYKETRKKVKGGYKYYLTESEEGAMSFLARPEYIRSSDIDIIVSTTRNVSQIKAVEIEQNMRLIELFVQLFALTVPGPTGQPPVLTKDELPPIKEIVEDLMKLMGKKVITKTENQETAKDAEDDMIIEQIQQSKGISNLTPTPNAAPATQ